MNRLIPILMAATLLFTGCEGIDPEFVIDKTGQQSGPTGQRVDSNSSRKALLYYTCGFNSLSPYIESDIRELIEESTSGMPGKGEDLLFIYSHTTEKYNNYSYPAPAYLLRVYKEGNGKTVTDTLVKYETGVNSASKEQLSRVLTYLQDKYIAGNWGMIMSSHGTGWLPEGYYSNPTYYDKLKSLPAFRQPVRFAEKLQEEGMPAVKSWGQAMIGLSRGYEMDIRDLAQAIPFHLDYILFDTCFMGGIEVAWELKDVCDKIAFSQTEILANGFDYKSLLSHIFCTGEPDLEAVCNDYFIQYDSQESLTYKSATISLVDCTALNGLGEACRQIFDTCRSRLGTVNASSIQRYFRKDDHWFYDLEDIVAKIDPPADLLEDFENALDECVMYKAATKQFMGSFEIRSHCGLSCYLPVKGSQYLDNYYKTLSWNEACGLVK